MQNSLKKMTDRNKFIYCGWWKTNKKEVNSGLFILWTLCPWHEFKWLFTWNPTEQQCKTSNSCANKNYHEPFLCFLKSSAVWIFWCFLWMQVQGSGRGCLLPCYLPWPKLRLSLVEPQNSEIKYFPVWEASIDNACFRVQSAELWSRGLVDVVAPSCFLQRDVGSSPIMWSLTRARRVVWAGSELVWKWWSSCVHFVAAFYCRSLCMLSACRACFQVLLLWFIYHNVKNAPFFF